MPEPPRHYPRLKRLNASGAPVIGSVPVLPPLELETFRERLDAGATLVDTRSILGFGGGHFPGAINIGMSAHFWSWSGWMLPSDAELLLVSDSPADAQAAVTHLFRLGFDQVAGYLHSGMNAWQNAALPLSRLGEWTVQELDARKDDAELVVLDVRSGGEWEEGHVRGARHIYAPHLEGRLGELDPAKTIATYCGSNTAPRSTSVLARNGFQKVVNIPGSMNAWKAAGLPLEQ